MCAIVSGSCVLIGFEGSVFFSYRQKIAINVHFNHCIVMFCLNERGLCLLLYGKQCNRRIIRNTEGSGKGYSCGKGCTTLINKDY